MATIVETINEAGQLVEVSDPSPPPAPEPAAPRPEAPSGDSAPPPVSPAAPPPEAPSAAPAPAPVTDSEDSDPDSRDVPRGVQKRFDTLTRQREDARREAQALREQMALLHGQVDTLTRLQRGDEPQPAVPLHQQPEPQAEDFASEQEWFSAVRQWDKAQLKAELVRDQYQQAARAEEQRLSQALAAREATVRARYPDYEAQIQTLGPKGLTPQVYQALMQHELGPDLGYYLAQHPDDLQRLAPLPPLQVWRELGKLEARLVGNGSTPPPASSVVPSSAPKPAPLTPVGSGGSGAPTVRLDDPNVPQRDWEVEAARQYPGIFGRKR